MAESMQGLKRTHRCTEVSTENIGEKVTVMGWVQKRRNLGALIFVDLRDRSGILQIVFDQDTVGEEGFLKAGTLRNEFVIAVEGLVQKRSAAVNENLKTGDIEVAAESIRILSESETPPFPIEEDSQTRDEVRLKYRYLDLRRPDIQKNMMLRSKVIYLMRDFMMKEGFLEIETPILCKSTPEGARDYLVPSRVHPGNFYALPQSPQLYKQLLMCSGFDRYFQIAKCFRDEDLRADRQPEFTQADMELSFVDVDDVIEVNERLIQYVFREAIGVDVKIPFQRMPWQEAMDRFGSDKPDTRFGMELKDVSPIVKDCGFGVFTGALTSGGTVRGINAKGQGAMPRKKIDNLLELNSLSAVLTIAAFTLQIYFDFSGYCDMAVGLGRLFNIHVTVNFQSPYKAVTISDFWKRWHMTLTRFLTAYLYIPLGGNRKGLLRTCVNTMIVFTVSGLWHGAAWTYVLWGVFHGMAMVVSRVGKKWLERVPKWLLWLGTFSFVNVAWVFFRAEYFRQPWRLLGRLLGGGSGRVHTAITTALCDGSIWLIILERFLGEGMLQAGWRKIARRIFGNSQVF